MVVRLCHGYSVGDWVDGWLNSFVVSTTTGKVASLRMQLVSLVIFLEALLQLCALHGSPSTYQLQIERGYPLNLSILISGGKENNCDSISNGE